MAVISPEEFLVHRQRVLKAMAMQTPRSEWRKMPPVSRMLLAAVVVTFYKERYYAQDGYLSCSWRKLALDIFGWDIGILLTSCARTYCMLEIKQVQGGHNRSRLVVTPQVQQLLDDLDGYEIVFDPSR